MGLASSATRFRQSGECGSALSPDIRSVGAPTTRAQIAVLTVFVAVCAVLLSISAARAQLSPDLPPVSAAPGVAGGGGTGPAGDQSLQLEVLVRGEPLGRIGAFRRDGEGRLWATGADLNALGLKTPPGQAPDAEIDVSTLPGAAMAYDVAAQRIDFDAGDEARLPKDYDLYAAPDRTPAAPASFGFVLNYQAFTSIGAQNSLDSFLLEGSSVNLDARLSTPVGVFSQTGFVTTNRFDAGSTAVRRLDTTWTWTDVERAIVWRAGDTISGGFPWTRPIRIGGLQAQRNFAVRPDLVTLPLPGATGVALAPSVVDVYVNGFQTASQQIGAGPYRINNIPALSGQGDARIVLRDASGRVVETSNPFFVSGKLLRAGMWNFSAEAGYPRYAYGSLSNDYGAEPVASGSVAVGISDRLTLQGHMEGARRFGSVGIGAVAAIGGRFLAGGAFSASYHKGKAGYQGYLSGETRLGNVTLSASALRSFGAYSDLASVTARPEDIYAAINPLGVGGVQLSSRPVRAQYTASVSAPTGILNTSVNVGYVHYRALGGDRSDIITAGLSAPLPWRGNAYVSAWGDLAQRRNSGILAGVSFPIGGDVTVSANAGRDAGGVYVGAQASKPIGREPGSYGWRISDREGGQPRRLASAGYRSAYGQAEVTAGQFDDRFYGSAQIEGALVAAGGDLFVTNRIEQSYAVVDAGAPSVPVTYENRPAGVTNARGRALIPTLPAWSASRIGIDPTNLPLNAVAPQTQEIVAPRDRSGVVVRFGVEAEARSATVILVDAEGKHLQAGLTGKTATGERFVIGYDGRAFITQLAASNEATIDTPAGTCVASFAYAPANGVMQTLGPETCK